MLIQIVKKIHKMTNRYLTAIESYLAKPKLNLLKTIYVNFRLLPITQAVKIPIYIYGKVTLYSLGGKVTFTCNEIKRKMIILGAFNDKFYATRKSALLVIPSNSEILFDGPVRIGIDYTIRLNSGAKIHFGEMVRCASGVKICAEKQITIGNYTGITFDCQLMDTNFHYTIDETSNEISRKSKEIKIGSYNWIGNRSVIMKGTKTDDYTIVTTGSLLNKDYTKENNDIKKSVLLAGVPAKIKRYDIKRIFSGKIQKEIDDYFMTNYESEVYTYPNKFKDNPNDLFKL